MPFFHTKASTFKLTKDTLHKLFQASNQLVALLLLCTEVWRVKISFVLIANSLRNKIPNVQDWKSYKIGPTFSPYPASQEAPKD